MAGEGQHDDAALVVPGNELPVTLPFTLGGFDNPGPPPFPVVEAAPVVWPDAPLSFATWVPGGGMIPL